MESIEILGEIVPLRQKPKDELQKLTEDTQLSYTIYDGELFGISLIFLEPNGANPTPCSFFFVSIEVSKVLAAPAVLLLKPTTSSERKRLISKGLFFVMSAKHAHLPKIIESKQVSDRKLATRMTPVAQFLLFYHLQINTIEGMVPKDVASLVPYSYESITLGLTCLADLGICEKLRDGKLTRFHFIKKGRELWMASQPFAISPVGRRFYCDSLSLNPSELPVCGINALAHYSMMSPELEKTIMLAERQYREGAFVGSNGFAGEYSIEVWKYPALDNSGFVDRLSLSIALKDSADERVQSELERMMSNIVWKD